MSGLITDLGIRACPHCGATYIEDENMYEDTDRCPGCGRILEPEEKSDDDDEIWV